jgi:CubicO group peptidase (beta-lactamase class C family)
MPGFVPQDQVARLAETLDSDPQKQTMVKSYRITENPAGKQYFKGGAGLVSTVADYHRFAQMVANGGELDGKRILSKKTIEYMLSNHTVGTGGSPTASTGPGYGFGLGFAVRLQDGFRGRAGLDRRRHVGWRLGHELHDRPEGAARRGVHGAGAVEPRAHSHAVQKPDLRRDGRVEPSNGRRGGIRPRRPRSAPSPPRSPAPHRA